jgi:hypothetical protein
MIVNCQKGKEVKNEEGKILVQKDNNNEIFINIIGTNNKMYLKQIPCFILENEDKIHFVNIGTGIYVILEDFTNKITYFYMIEQKLENEEIIVNNIYHATYVSTDNILERFFHYNKEFEEENLNIRLKFLIENINVIFEKEYLLEKINEYLSLEDNIKSIKKETKRRKYAKREYVYNGKKVTLKELEKITGVQGYLIVQRLGHGWSLEKAISEPKQKPRRI